MQGQRYLNRVSLLLVLMIILKSLLESAERFSFELSGRLRVCEGGRGREKTKIRKFKNKKKFDLQKVKNREKREKKSRLVVKLVQYQMFLNVTSFFASKTEAEAPSILNRPVP